MHIHTPKIFGIAIILSSLLSPAHAAVVDLDPLQAGVYTGGDGVLSRWVQTKSSWPGVNGSSPGLETLADQDAALALPSTDSNILRSFEGTVATINFSDDVYRDKWAATWSPAGTTPVPLFPASNDPNQNDFAVSFAGFIAITTPGEYNFGVLFDDAFRFTLTGANGSYTIFKDGLNPREIVGFDSNFALEAGMYQFSLASFEHLEAGVVALNWWHGPTTSDFGVIPPGNLFSALPPVPEPEEWLLFVVGLLTLAWYFRKKPSTLSVLATPALSSQP